MSTQLTTTKRAAAGATAKNSTMISAEAVPEEIEDTAEASSSQPIVALTPAQIRAMVFNAFNSASNQLHAPDEEGILECITTPEAEITIDRTAAGPHSGQLVDTDTLDAAQEKKPKKRVRFAEPQKGARGALLYVPGVGCLYQDDDKELGCDS